MGRAFMIFSFILCTSAAQAGDVCHKLWQSTFQLGDYKLSAGPSQMIVDGRLASYWTPGMDSMTEWQIVDHQLGRDFAQTGLARWALNEGDQVAILSAGNVLYSGYFKEIDEPVPSSEVAAESTANMPYLYRDAGMTEILLDPTQFKKLFAENARAVVLHRVAFHERSQLLRVTSAFTPLKKRLKPAGSLNIQGQQIQLQAGETAFEAELRYKIVSSPFEEQERLKANPPLQAVTVKLYLDVNGDIREAESLDHLYFLDDQGELLAETEIGHPHSPIGEALTVEQKLKLFRKTAKVIVIRVK